MTKKVTVKAKNPNDAVFRVLSTATLVSSAEFAKQTAPKQTEIISLAGPIQFVKDFTELSNVKTLRERLLKGQDVSLQCEFNGIVITDEDRAAIAAIKPLLSRLDGLKPLYPWEKEVSTTAFVSDAGKRITRNGYGWGMITAKTAWNKASAFWAGGKLPAGYSVGSSWNSSGRLVEIAPNQIKIGCQTIPRNEVEAIARMMGWEPNVG